MISFFHHLLFLLCSLILQYGVSYSAAQTINTDNIIRVHYGYFPEVSPIRVACARGWFTYLNYHVTCYPQTSGNFAAQRLDSGSLHLSELGSTPLAQALARGVDIQVVFIDQYKGDSQGIYVRPDNVEKGYKGVEHPFDLIGKKLAVPFHSTMHYQTLFLLDILGMTGKVELINSSPQQIVELWDNEEIDAAGCWGLAREHILSGDAPGNVLVSSGVLADWGRETFNVVAVRRDFMNENGQFVEHFVSILGLLTDSFLDNLGEVDMNNVQRWSPDTDPVSSYIPSLTDTLMKASEEAGYPSIEFINTNRRALDLPKQISTKDQLSCDYLGGGHICERPSLVHVAIQQTAQFLMDQKVIYDTGVLSEMGDDVGCLDFNTLCGSDIVSSSSLNPMLYQLEPWDGVAPFYALNETGRENQKGDSDSCLTTIDAGVVTQYFGDSPSSYNSLVGKSYSDNLNCWWIINSGSYQSVVVSFLHARIWSGDAIRVYREQSARTACHPESNTKVLLGKITGFDPELPQFQSDGCIMVHFKTDSNRERSYNDIQNIGDGFTANTYATNFAGSSDTDSATLSHCFGTSNIDLKDFNKVGYISSGDDGLYLNEIDCRWEIETGRGSNLIQFEVEYDLEPTFDYLELYSGSFSSTSGVNLHAKLSGDSSGRRVYYIPTDDNGFATIRLVTDGMGRRTGIKGSLSQTAKEKLSICPSGKSGLLCEISHCIMVNDLTSHSLGLSSSDIHPDYQIGRVISQIKDHSVPSNTNCAWPFGQKVACNTEGGCPTPYGIRLRFNSPLDLEPHSASSIGDKLLVKTGEDELAAEIFVEECTTDEVCSYSWQTGKCENGACTVRQSIDINMDTLWGQSELRLITDRNDGGKMYNGIDFDTLFVAACPAEFGEAHCEDGAGKCVDGACICGDEGIPCTCPCDADRVSSTVNTAILVAVVVPLVVVFIAVFIWYRRRKIKKSRVQKAIILAKEEELEAFRNSVVGMRTAICNYMPKPIDSEDKDQCTSVPAPTQKVQWCWKETKGYMSNHAPDTIAGNADDCWIKYDPMFSAMIEAAYQSYYNSKKEADFKGSVSQSFKKVTAFKPHKVDESNFIVQNNGYKIDVRSMTQVKEATGFQRDIQRLVETVHSAPEKAPDIDIREVEIGDSLPEDLTNEPQVVLVKGDIIQISSQRQDGWAYCTKLHMADEVTARELVRLTSKGEVDASIHTDCGWFPLDKTEIPTGDELAVLETKVGSTDALQAPEYWNDIIDPTIVQLHELQKGDAEYERVASAFMSTLKPPRFSRKVKVVSVERIQNLAMWQTYVVKRQTICYRETGGQDNSPEEMKRVLDRVERSPLWHGTNIEVMGKIMQQGFNRSFCGKNATVYGKGVYFARDAEYSAHTTYAVPDKSNIQYMLACRVTVGEYCPGVRNALTPDVRDPSTQMLYDTTVGLLSNDTMDSPSIYVTYHDAQAYPEYLIKFKSL